MWTSGRLPGDDKTQHEHHWTSTWKPNLLSNAQMFFLGGLLIYGWTKAYDNLITHYVLAGSRVFFSSPTRSPSCLTKALVQNHLNISGSLRPILTLQGNFALNNAFLWDSMPSPPHLHPSHHTSCDAPNGLRGGGGVSCPIITWFSEKRSTHTEASKQASLPSSRP